MKTAPSFLVVGALVLACASVGQWALAAGAVVESQPAVPGQGSAGSPAGSVAGSDALLLLLEQNRNLQAEVQALRAMVEEQGYELRRLQRESLDRYTDTDSRLSSLEQNTAAGTAAASAGLPAVAATPQIEAPLADTQSAALAQTVAQSAASPASDPLTPRGNDPVGGVNALQGQSQPLARSDTSTAARSTLEPVVLSEQQLYQMAYDSAINSRFERAIAEFDQYLAAYPGGRFISNAHYWRGQSFLYLDRFEEAIGAYDVILQQYPSDAKVPDATYGMAVAYEGMGNVQRARQILQDILRRFPNTGVANLADTRLRSLN